MYFLTEDYKFAEDYAYQKSFEQEIDGDANVMEVYAKAEKVFDPSDKNDIEALRKVLPDKLQYWATEFDKETALDRIQRKDVLPPKWTKEQIDNAKFGKVVGNDRFGYCDDLFIGINNNGEVVYTKHSNYRAFENMSENEKQDVKKKLLNGEKVVFDYYSTPFGYMSYEAIEDEIKQSKKDGNDRRVEMLQETKNAIDNHETWKYQELSDTISPYTDSLEETYLDDIDNWQYIETLFDRESGKDVFQYIQDLGYDAINIYEKGVSNYVVFNKNQIKDVNNQNPTNANDIRYSLNNSEWDQFSNEIDKQTGKKDRTYFEENLLEQIDQEIDEENAKKQAKKEAKEKGETRPKLPVNKISENNFKQQVAENRASKYKSKADKYYTRAKNKFINNLTDRLDISKGSNKEILNDTIDKIENLVQEKGEITSTERDTLFDEMFDNVVKIDDEYYNQYKDLKQEIAKQKIYVDEQAVKDIAHAYDGFNNFRKRNFGNLNLTTDSSKGLSIDRFYQELNGAYGNLFPDNIYTTGEQLQYIADVVKDIRKSEMNLSSYDDEVLGGELRQYARQEFDGLVDDLIAESKRTERYKEDRENIKKEQKQKAKESNKDIKEKYKMIPELQKQYEKVSNTELLTQRDRVELDRLFKGEIKLDDIASGLNRKGIEKVYKAGKKLKQLQQQLKQDKALKKKANVDNASNIIGDLSKWKDKKLGLQYTRETPVRNFQDIAPKDVADKINNYYIYNYRKNEARKTKMINSFSEQIKDLNLSERRKYNATFQVQDRDENGMLYDKKDTRKVSEAELVQIYGEGRISRSELEQTGVDVNKIEKAVERFRKQYDRLLDLTNEVLLSNGMTPVPKTKNYFPHFVEGEDTTLQKIGKLVGIDLTGQELPTTIAGKTQDFKPDKTWVGNFLQRKTNITDFNALKGYDRYIRSVSDVIYHTGDIMRMRGLETAVRQFYADDTIKQRIQDVIEDTTLTEDERIDRVREISGQIEDKSHLSNFINWWGDYVNSLAGKKSINDRSMEKEVSRKYYQAMNKLQSRFSANAIGGNISVALTNTGVVFSALGETSPVFLLKGAYQTANNNIRSLLGKSDDSFVGMSDFLTNRRGTETTHVGMLDKATAPVNKLLAGFDDLSTEIITRAKYEQNLHDGMSEYDALLNADNYVAGLVADRSKGMLPTQFNKTNPLAKLINAFQVEANNQLSYAFKDVARNNQDKAKMMGWNKTEAGINLAKSFGALFIGNFMINEILSNVRGNQTRLLLDPIYMLKELIKGFTDDDDDNDGEVVKKTIEELIGQLPFVAGPLSLFGQELGLDTQNIGRIPVAGAVPDVGKIAETLKGDYDSEYKKQEVWKEMQKPIFNIVLPYGGTQLRKTANAVDTIVKGEKTRVDKEGNESIKYVADNKGVWNVTRALLFGDTARSEYQEYANNGYKGLNAEQTQLYRKSKIPYRALLDYIKTDFTSDRDEEGKVIQNSKRNKKIDYIESMNLTDAQKNDMYKYDIFTDKQLETAKEIKEDGGNVDEYYTYLRETIKMEADKDKEGNTIPGSSKAKKLEWILNSDISDETKDTIINKSFSTEKTTDSLSNYKYVDKDYGTLLYYCDLDEDGKEEYNTIAKAGVDQKNYIEFKNNIKELTKQGKATDTKTDNMNQQKICKELRNSSLSKEDKAQVYELDIGKKDSYYKYIKASNMNINEYLKYKEQNFESDKVDDGTLNGKTVNGSLKEKKVNYVNSMNITYEQKLLLLGSQYSMSKKERTMVANYINKLNLSKQDKLNLYSKMKGFTVYKDGRVSF